MNIQIEQVGGSDEWYVVLRFKEHSPYFKSQEKAEAWATRAIREVAKARKATVVTGTGRA